VTLVDVAPATDTGTDRRRFTAACAVGATLSAIVYTWMLNHGTFNFFRLQLYGAVFDSQAHSLWHGRWDIPPDALGFDAFVVHGRSYTYLGPFPAILRMPVVALTSNYDGRLTQVSMLLGFAVAMVFASTLSWRIRRLVRSDAPVTRLEVAAVAVDTFVLGAGSAIFYLASTPLVFHEAELWGAALTIAALDRILEFILRPRRVNLAWAGLATTLACLARGSTGAGAVVALGIVLLAQLVVVVAPRFQGAVRVLGLRAAAERGHPVQTTVAVVTPIALFAYTNWVKFGTFFSVPWTKQLWSTVSPDRRRMLDANHVTLFGVKFVFSNVVQYVRPDALRTTLTAPYVTFPPKPSAFGNVIYDARDWTSSVPSSMPLFVVLGIIGFVAIWRTLPELRVLVIGAFVAVVPTLLIGYLSNRYLADFMPLLVVCSLAGLHVLLRNATNVSTTRLKAGAVVFVVLAAVSVWVNFGLAYAYQREFAPFIPTSAGP
jgi:hypothetical protein